jgi:hypothetical protein
VEEAPCMRERTVFHNGLLRSPALELLPHLRLSSGRRRPALAQSESDAGPRAPPAALFRGGAFVPVDPQLHFGVLAGPSWGSLPSGPRRSCVFLALADRGRVAVSSRARKTLLAGRSRRLAPAPAPAPAATRQTRFTPLTNAPFSPLASRRGRGNVGTLPGRAG